MRPRHLLPILVLFLAGCEQLGFDDPARIAAVREAEGKAVGGACRHSGRALEDCYAINPKASKAAIFAGWRDMDAYMRENNIQVVIPNLVEPPGGNDRSAPPSEKAAEAPQAEGSGKTAAGAKTGIKHGGIPPEDRARKIT
jgi:hypothetical protein